MVIAGAQLGGRSQRRRQRRGFRKSRFFPNRRKKSTSEWDLGLGDDLGGGVAGGNAELRWGSDDVTRVIRRHVDTKGIARR